MKISHIETIPVRVPINQQRAIHGGRGAHVESPFVLVKVHTDEGLIGLGEVSCTPIWSGEDQTTAIHCINTYLAPLLIGEDPTAIERLTLRMHRRIAGHPFTKAGVEIALWDVLGKIANVPLYRLFGGPVRDAVPTKFSVSGREPDRAAEIAAWAVEQGFRTMKIKVGIEPEQDIARVRAVRAAVGPDIRLAIDANGGWSPHTAIHTIRRLVDCDLIFAEQPVPPFDVTWMAEVRRQTTIPIMADESMATLQDAMAIARASAADILSIYVGKGGLGMARKIAAVAEAAGMVCTVGSNLELGIAGAAMIHLALATTAIDAEAFPCDIIGPFFYESDILAEPLPVQAGIARAPSGLGLGVVLDERKVAQYRVH
ncbi:mandelate racemase/muconate lactonizing enzyme family protein [Roseiflexus sp.]|uniref:mandelate racemase/muconate lactonizing enzyme family protein n=1 Tax=Roseiflexus sp. TaxID=2562120 RepID=UPI00398B1FC7